MTDPMEQKDAAAPDDAESRPSPPTPAPRDAAEPVFEAVVPETPRENTLFNDIDAYQRRIEADWEAVKSNYQLNIDQIMDEFLREKLRSGEENGPAPAPAPASDAPHKSGATAPDLAEEIKNTLHQAEEKMRQLTLRSGPRPRILDARWRSPHATRRALLVAATTALVLAASVAAVVWFRTPARVTPLPYARTAGPVIDGNRIYIFDWFRQTLFVHTARRGLPITSVEHIPNRFLTGLAVSGERFYSLDGLSHAVLQHATTPDHQVLARVPTPGRRPVGLVFDGTDLWSADTGEEMLFRHHGRDLAEIRDRFPLPPGHVTAFALHQHRLWVLDGENRLLRIYRLQKPPAFLSSLDLDTFLDGAKPTGLAVEEKTVSLLTEDPAKLLRIPKKLLHRQQRTAGF